MIECSLTTFGAFFRRLDGVGGLGSRENCRIFFLRGEVYILLARNFSAEPPEKWLVDI